MAKENPLADALGAGIGRRRAPGEAARSGPAKQPRQIVERRVGVDIPVELYRQVKVLAAETGVTVKQVIVDGLRAELEWLQQAR